MAKPTKDCMNCELWILIKENPDDVNEAVATIGRFNLSESAKNVLKTSELNARFFASGERSCSESQFSSKGRDSCPVPGEFVPRGGVRTLSLREKVAKILKF
ncbi:hypothetical protein CO009_03440 [Candidatus Shapirobacteria bacterium CG_4_8_14_3_um_filter_35_11]|uniref:Uncharacterized protein n=2 Tax=Candidatus Shapironibacteriota TaxID=1752721 RepID=A0A2M7XNG6_9BACT|nr:MAG: hypothetical protein CO168_02390 [Candidatus Shapirobacteria bacterium CG_4_9_14_3_um_filter_36_12]PJC79772.1 MAG: hypothetical protein CO009_03440 [Candidatus Shapirobacteria bacterium CG_4_8_14_3_um_filter_35_11]